MSESEKAQISETAGEPVHSGITADVRRRSAVALVHTIYRLVKACLLHTDSNQAVLSLLPAAIETIEEFCELSDVSSVTLVFAGETVFINGQMLRSSREAYDVARELGTFFDTCSVSELVLEKTVRRADLAAFARLLAEGQRDREVAANLAQSTLRGIRVRKIRSPFAGGSALSELSLIGRVSRTYAAAILVMRAFYAALRVGEAILPQRLKRVAQRLVSAAEDDARMLLSLAAAKVADPDEASMSVSTAIVALGIARQLTTDRRLLSGLVTAALLYDVGRLRLTRSIATLEAAVPFFIERSLNDEEKERLAASTAVVLTALGKLHSPSITRTVIAYEALALRPGMQSGPVYGGRRSPTVLARILAAARTFTEFRSLPLPAPSSSASGSPLDEVLRRMLAGSESATERAIIKLLIGALGIFPTGTLVELNTGELGVVLSTPSLPSHFAQPPVRVVFDGQGNLLDSPRDIDLSAMPEGAPPQFIVRPVEVEPRHEKAIRAAIGGRVRRASPAPHSASKAYTNDEIPPTEPGRELARHATVQPAPSGNERGRVAPATPTPTPGPAPARAEAAWLGRPLTSSGTATPPAAGPQSRRQGHPLDRSGPTERSGAAEKVRDENLISTQPPPAAAFATAPLAVPPPPRLPRDSLRDEALTSKTPQSPQARSVNRRNEMSTDPLLPPRAEGDAIPTVVPSALGIEEPLNSRASQRWQASRRVEPMPEANFAWDDELPTIDPPPITSPSPAFATAPLPSPSDVGDPIEQIAHALVFHEASPDLNALWNSDDQPTLDPPPPSVPLLERDRLLAAYLAERTPRPHTGLPKSSRDENDPRGGPPADPRRSTPPSSHAVPSSRNSPLSTAALRRSARAPIPREEPEEDGEARPPTSDEPSRS